VKKERQEGKRSTIRLCESALAASWGLTPRLALLLQLKKCGARKCGCTWVAGSEVVVVAVGREIGEEQRRVKGWRGVGGWRVDGGGAGACQLRS
jgi:hypothetical protein